jgi:hypothetical protein
MISRLFFHASCLAAIMIFSARSNAAGSARWVGPLEGSWSNPTNWSIGVAPNSSVTNVGLVELLDPAATVHIDVPVELPEWSLILRSGGVLDLANNVRFRNLLWQNGTIRGPGEINLTDGFGIGAALDTHVVLEEATLSFENCNFTSGILELHNLPALSANLVIRSGAELYTDGPYQRAILVTPDGTRSHLDNFGSLRILDELTSQADILNHNEFQIDGELTLTNSDLIQDSGSLALNLGSIVNRSTDSARGKVVINSGDVVGPGNIDWALIGGAGGAPVRISGSFTFRQLNIGSNATVALKIAGRVAGLFEQHMISESATIRGTLELAITGGFEEQIQATDVFEIVALEPGATLEGGFANAPLGQRFRVGNFGTFLVVHPPGKPNSVALTDFKPIGFKFEPGFDPEFGYYPIPLKTYFVAAHDTIETNGPVNWDGGSLEIKIEPFNSGEDHLTILSTGDGPGQINAVRDSADPTQLNILFGGTLFATASGFSTTRNATEGDTLLISLRAAATTEALQALFSRCAYTNDIYGFDAFTNDLSRVFPTRDLVVTLRDADHYHAEEVKTVYFPKVLYLATSPPYITLSPSTPKLFAVEAIFDNIQRTESFRVGTNFHFQVGTPGSQDGCSELGANLVFTPKPNQPGATQVAVTGPNSWDIRCSIDISSGPLRGSACLRVLSVSPNVVRCALDASDRDAVPGCEDLLPSPAPAGHSASASSVPVPKHSGLIALSSLRALESLMLQTPEGRRLRDLYWRHTTELVSLCLEDTTLFSQIRDVTIRFQPALNSFIAGKGSNSVVISSSAIAALNALWNTVVNRCGAQMRADMEAERSRFHGFQDFVGKNFAQWGEMLQIPVPSAPAVLITGARSSATRFDAEANIISGMSYTLFRSTNLVDWSALPATTLTTNGFFLNISDSTSSETERFYKLSIFP